MGGAKLVCINWSLLPFADMSTPIIADSNQEQHEQWWRSEANLLAMRHYAMQNGLMLRRSTDLRDDSCVQVSFTVLPSVFPEELFHFAHDIQEDLNSLVDAVSQDHEFILHVLGSVIKTDDFTRRLFEIYEEVRHDNRQTCALGMHRSDYMVDLSADPGGDGNLCLRQIELNTMASSFFGLTSRLKEFHEYVQSRYTSSSQLVGKLPENPCLQSLVDVVACAWKAYEKPSSSVLMVVNPGERNVFDHRIFEFDLWKRHNITILRRTLTQLTDDASLGPDRELLVSGTEIAVVYYRSGYSPDNYVTEKEWQVRLLMERSRASNCPSAGYQLVGTKKMQQALAEPGALERFVKDPTAAIKIRSTFAGLYSLDMTPAGDRAVEMALKDPEKFVVKPQREGGGNNYYGDDVRTLLQKIGSSAEREAFILMDRVRPPTQEGLILRERMFQLEMTPLVGELGVFGVFVRKGNQVLFNSHGGHILRTKVATVDEGGVSYGAGSLDTPALVSVKEFIKLTHN